MNGHPRLVPWKFSSELQTLKHQFFPTSSDNNDLIIIANKKKAITRTLSYQLKTQIPHSLLSTAHLTTIQLRFQNTDKDEVDESLQLMSTMALIRFVNGLLDPSQQSTFAIPLSVLAKKIGLPSWFVEVRHEGTHDCLPSLEMLELSIAKALDWLYVNYWGKLITETEEEAKLNLDAEQQVALNDKFKALMKGYRRIKKLDMTKEYKQNDTTEIGKEFWGIIKDIKGSFQVDLFIGQILPGGKLKFDKVKQMYETLLHYILVNDDEDELYIVELLEALVLKIYQHEKFKDTSFIKENTQLIQAQQWCEWIVIDRIKFHNELKLNKFIDIIGKFSEEFNRQLLIKLQSQKKFIKKEMANKITNKLDQLSNEKNTKANENEENSKKHFLDFEDIDDITNDLDNLKKRLQTTSTSILKQEPNFIKPFQSYPDWESKPFGVV